MDNKNENFDVAAIATISSENYGVIAKLANFSTNNFGAFLKNRNKRKAESLKNGNIRADSSKKISVFEAMLEEELLSSYQSDYDSESLSSLK